MEENEGPRTRGRRLKIQSTVETLYKNIGHKNNLVWKNIFPSRENFVSDSRIISFPRIFLGIIDLFLYPNSQTHDLPLP
jgi:hypothetical protein